MLIHAFPCPPEAVKSILDEARGFGAVVEGDQRAGTVSADTIVGEFLGTYAYDGTVLTLKVTRKPSLVPDNFLVGRLEDVARRYGSPGD